MRGPGRLCKVGVVGADLEMKEVRMRVITEAGPQAVAAGTIILTS